jgi:nucleoside-diphosphate-sugar epimerase
VNVFVAGGTGVVGRRAVAALVAAGHTVTVVSRSSGKDELVTALGARPVRIDLFDAGAVTDAVAGYEAVVNLATHIPAFRDAGRKKAWQVNDRLRTTGARNLGAAAAAAGADRLVQESITFPYADRGDEWMDEGGARVHSWATETSVAAEAAAADFTVAGGTAVVLRFAQFYAGDSEHVQAMIGLAKRGIAAVAGPANAYQPWVHAEDAGAAVVAALAAPGGVYNVVDDEPLQRGEIRSIMAKAANRSRLASIPRPVMRAVGGSAAALLMRSQRVSNRRLKEATGWAPQYPTLREGWPGVVPPD